MKIQDHVVKVTKEVADEFFRYAAAVPDDKLDWKPMDAGQSVLSMCREAAMTPEWAVDVMNGTTYSDEERVASFARMASWATIEDCRVEFLSRFTSWAALIAEFPEDRFEETRWLPYNGGRDHTFLEMFEYPRWNFTYHLGQVAYIQTLYGDKEMH